MGGQGREVDRKDSVSARRGKYKDTCPRQIWDRRFVAVRVFSRLFTGSWRPGTRLFRANRQGWANLACVRHCYPAVLSVAAL